MDDVKTEELVRLFFTTHNTSVRVLVIKHKGIGDRAAVALSSLTSVCRLALQGNRIGLRGVMHLAAMDRVIAFDLSDNALTRDDVIRARPCFALCSDKSTRQGKGGILL